MSALSFAHPWLLLALASLPVIWFLLRAIPQAPRQQVFPGLFFLRQLQSREETPSRTPWPLLLLRLSALGLIVIAIAGPILNDLKKTTQNAPLLIILDDTWSAANDWTARQSALRSLARETEGTTRAIWLITTSPTATSEQQGTAIRGPLTPEQLLGLAQTIRPQAFAADRAIALSNLQKVQARLQKPADIRWLSDSVFTGSDIIVRRFVRQLSDLGKVIAYADNTASTAPILRDVRYRTDNLEAQLNLTEPAALPLSGTLKVLARDGRLLTQATYLIPQGSQEIKVKINLPLSLRNEIGLVRLAGQQSASAIQLADASARRSLVGLAGARESLSGTLLDGRFYIRQALAPYSLFRTGTINELAKSEATVIVLDDTGRLRKAERSALERWVSRGGILIRFAGPTLADAAQAGLSVDEAALLPVPLRGGGRAFGGALTWEEPQALGGFSKDSPFADLLIPPEVRVRRQVLARPSPQTTDSNWAYLADGTPLLTARAKGKGLIVLFHVTASPSWSDLPVSGLYVEILRRLSALSITSTSRADPMARYQPRRILNGFGRLEDPADNAQTASLADARQPGTPAHPPGLYGKPDTPLAINIINANTRLASLTAVGAYDGSTLRPYQNQPPRSLAKWFLLAGFVLLLLDALATLALQGKLRPFTAKHSTTAPCLVILAGLLIITPLGQRAYAQDRAVLSPQSIEAALNTRFAYVITGETETDAISQAGLNGLRLRLAARTALEAAEPVGVRLIGDDLSVYPLLYWPILPTTPIPEEQALSQLARFMAGGGLIIFDTRDGARIFGNRQSAEGIALSRILEQLDIPPLEPLPEGHVLRRSFYLLEDLPGRNQEGTVWVEAKGAIGNLNDGVTPIIIGGRDWAAAWAVDKAGRPLRPMGAGATARRREDAIRAGVNMAMVALTGNYKVDQLQAEALLDQLGTERNGQ